MVIKNAEHKKYKRKSNHFLKLSYVAVLICFGDKSITEWSTDLVSIPKIEMAHEAIYDFRVQQLNVLFYLRHLLLLPYHLSLK